MPTPEELETIRREIQRGIDILPELPIHSNLTVFVVAHTNMRSDDIVKAINLTHPHLHYLYICAATPSASKIRGRTAVLAVIDNNASQVGESDNYRSIINSCMTIAHKLKCAISSRILYLS